ncbi:MAG TPA: PIG-L family deacetylase [Candidatus Saccharimonadales bacterium]|nr:PIG-L family deacetylase [Candidatus Saccharimonadales bacterium]
MPRGKTEETSPKKSIAYQLAAKYALCSRFIATSTKAWLKPDRIYALAGAAVLLATSWYWAVLGARIHMSNSDQLVNTYLFDNAKTFHGAQWPDQHTFLLKWPLFLVVHLFGATPHAFTAFTVGVVLATVGLLALILYRIERRPLVFGTLCLALASVLLLIPAQPYPGGILPVNMAMLTTRNIEYLVFISSIALLVYAPRMRHWKFATGVGLLVLLIASDKLFMSVSVGAAIIALLVYALAGKWSLAYVSARWLAASIAGAGGALALLWAINASGLTHIASAPLSGPYGFVHSMHDLLLGGVYMVLSLLTNLGANPAADTRLLATIPHQTYAQVFGTQGVALLANILLAAAAVVAMVRLLRSSITQPSPTLPHDNYFKISLLLIWSTAVSCGAFIATKHYYPVDARYLAIVLFTAFIALATTIRSLRWPSRFAVTIGVLFCLSIVAGLPATHHVFTAEASAIAATNKRNELIAKALSQHHVEALAGDYWRVFPAKLDSGNHLQVVPLSGCNQPRDILSSSQWQPDLRKLRFAYLLTLDNSLTGYPPCSIDQIIEHYGRPNASTLIAGDLKQPTELILFYDRGTQNSAPRVAPATSIPATIAPVDIDTLPYTACTGGTTIMNIVAHQDDDLLFINPDLQHDISAQHCVRTIYVTSGDAGADKYYWVGREQGSEAAYSNMLGSDSIWVERLARLPSGQFVTVANPRGNSRVSLLFMHLPDGNLRGQGFPSAHNESLAQLESGGISTIQTIDHQSTYTLDNLSTSLTALMHLYQPTEVRTQANVSSRTYPDHSDHMAVGRIAQTAYEGYLLQQYDGQPLIPLKFYVGYPIHGMAANVAGQDLQDKEQAFFAYAKYDHSVCNSEQQCALNSNYGWYLKREYQDTE